MAFIVISVGIAILFRLFAEDLPMGIVWGTIGGISSVGVPIGFAVLYHRETLKRLKRNREASQKPGLCPKCDYNLAGNVSGICPECGTVVKVPYSTSETI